MSSLKGLQPEAEELLQHPGRLKELSKEQLVSLSTTLIEEIKQHRLHAGSRYIIEPPVAQLFVSDEQIDRADTICAKWEPVASDDPAAAGWSARNLPWHAGCTLYWTGAEVQLRQCDPFNMDADECMDICQGTLPYELISSQLLLYRLCCLFKDYQVDVKSCEYPYRTKCVWGVQLKHKATGDCAGFTDCKGASLLRISKLPHNQKPFSGGGMSSQFQTDWLELLNLLCDAKGCPHPYGNVAGSVA